MTHITAIVLGFIEGITEFIPISSSGHLIIARQILNINYTGGLAFDAVLQLATSCALAVYFRNDIIVILRNAYNFILGKQLDDKDRNLLMAIVFGTIPAVIFGLLLERYMEIAFRSTHLIALTLILGSILFWYSQKFATKNQILTVGRGVVVGFFQCLALVPGVSRSGATISGGLIAGLTYEEAVRFSFLLSLPILLGSGIKKLLEVRHEIFSTDYGSSLLLGSVVAFIVGFISINFLIKYLKTHNLNLFIYYRVVLAILILILI